MGSTVDKVPIEDIGIENIGKTVLDKIRTKDIVNMGPGMDNLIPSHT